MKQRRVRQGKNDAREYNRGNVATTVHFFHENMEIASDKQVDGRLCRLDKSR